MSLSRSAIRLLYSVVKVHIARIVNCYAPNAPRHCRPVWRSAVRAIRPARLRLASLALRVVFYSGSPSCFAVYVWLFALPLTFWIIAHIRLFVNRNFFMFCFRFGNEPLFNWQFGLYHTFPVLSTMNLDFFKRILEFTRIVLISVCFALYYSYFSVRMFCILGIWDKADNCKLVFGWNGFTI